MYKLPISKFYCTYCTTMQGEDSSSSIVDVGLGGGERVRSMTFLRWNERGRRKSWWGE